MKDSKDVIKEFNEVVNMTASELEKWLKSDDSQSAGWPKENEDGESVGHDSGRKIVEILKANPKKEPEKYTDDQVQHMRKVVSYWSVVNRRGLPLLTMLLQQAPSGTGREVEQRKVRGRSQKDEVVRVTEELGPRSSQGPR